MKNLTEQETRNIRTMADVFTPEYARERLRGLVSDYPRLTTRTSEHIRTFWKDELRIWHNVVNLHLGREIE